jgi:hypothetical protein
VAKAEGADAKRASRDALKPGDFIPECRAKSSRNSERHQIGIVGEIIPECRATSSGISSQVRLVHSAAPATPAERVCRRLCRTASIFSLLPHAPDTEAFKENNLFDSANPSGGGGRISDINQD